MDISHAVATQRRRDLKHGADMFTQELAAFGSQDLAPARCEASVQHGHATRVKHTPEHACAPFWGDSK